MKEFIQNLTVIEERADTRQQCKVKHRLSEIIFIVLVATLANADEWFQMELFAIHNIDFFKQYISLKNGVPGHDTIRRAMAMLNPDMLQSLVNQWHECIQNGETKVIQKLIHIDGKTVCGNQRGNEKPAHIVSAYCSDDGYTVGQVKTDEKSNEITAIPQLLKAIHIKNSIVTIDAMGTQTQIAEIIKNECKADYLLAVKANQNTLYTDIKDFFDIEQEKEKLKQKGYYYKSVEKAHGQLETREYYHTDNIKWLANKDKWAAIKTIGMVQTTIKKDDKVSVECRYFISSLKTNINTFANAVRKHWSIEAMHWHLDVTFKEDANTTIDKNAVINQNIIRKWAMVILKRADTLLDKKYSLKAKRYIMSLDPLGTLTKALSL